MLNIELTQEQAVAALLGLCSEIEGYTQDPALAPVRITRIREVIAALDEALDAAAE